MYPSPGSWTYVTHETTKSGEAEFYGGWDVHFEVQEHAAVKDEESLGVNAEQFLLGVGAIIAGLYIIAAVLTAGVSIPIMIAGTVIGSFIAITGAGLVEFSFTEQSLSSFPSWFANRLPRAVRQIWEGIVNVVGKIAEVIVKVVEVVQKLGSALLHYGGTIVAAIVDIIYFVTAVAVWWLTAKFLAIMGAIRDGDVEKAARTILSVEGSIRGQTRRRVSDVKRIYKGGKRAYAGGKRIIARRK